MEERYLLKKPDSIKKKKRFGCGIASGKGKTCGKGQDGQMSRSGRKRRAWFEGGQMPLQRRIPKRGFNNYTRKVFQVVDVSVLERLKISEIDPEILKEKGIISHSDRLVKVLGNGDISSTLKVKADAFSKSALEKIKKAGGETAIRSFPIKKKAMCSMTISARYRHG